ncbi:hypothetical protein [Bradyrhizobium sp. NBAIM01]|uniref:hypothetical protein n=1 Tax=Bradyrhizobium sp. NBAIM01 TaxID=2793818 RepID=UPI001CD36BA3|nr:hypothetical protein [Bradyrhizobium sp. NBAIM01]MCA1510456.1 hypothetical protein [Bradyrhizobium sp. NBAIM01]
MLVLLMMLPVIMQGPMMIDMSISGSGIMLFIMVPPMIGASADDVGDDRGGRRHVDHAGTMIVGLFSFTTVGPAVVQASQRLV